MTDQPVEQLDAKAYFAEKNAAEQAAREGKEAPKPAEKPKEQPKPGQPEPEDKEHHISRSARREINKAREEAAVLRGRLQAIEEFGLVKKSAEPVKAEDDPEPKRENFATDAEYNRAAGRWDARQEARKELGKVQAKTSEQEQYAGIVAEVEAMDAKFQEDRKLIDNWDEIAAQNAEAAENGEAPIVNYEKYPSFQVMVARSPVRADVLMHWALNPKQLESFLELEDNSAEQIQAFHRLEGKVEGRYTTKQTDSNKPAQGSKEASEDRTHLAEAKPAGRTAAERDISKPRPSSEVAARGGSPAPDEPAPGTKAWMEARNRQKQTSNY